LAAEIAERQRQEAAARANPFGAAGQLPGQGDPFALADEQLKVRRAGLHVMSARDVLCLARLASPCMAGAPGPGQQETLRRMVRVPLT
jgi:hypothetical protein